VQRATNAVAAFQDNREVMSLPTKR
jgi:hypothetical protein